MVVVVVVEVVVTPSLPLLLYPHRAILPGHIHPSTHPRSVIDLYYVPGIILGFYKAVYAFISIHI